jgi:hypothetical protein
MDQNMRLRALSAFLLIAFMFASFGCSKTDDASTTGSASSNTNYLPNKGKAPGGKTMPSD